MSEEQTIPETENNPDLKDTSDQPEQGYGKVTMDQDPVTVTKDVKLTADDIKEHILSFLNLDVAGLDKIAEDWPAVDANATDNDARVWMASYIEGIGNLLKSNSLSSSVEREGANWRQKVEHEGEKLGASRPRFGESTSGKISGERALMKASDVLGLGSTVVIPLWHSGIWVTIKAPSESALLELERRIASEKIDLGRHTSGMIFSNSTIYTTSYAVNFVLNHIYDASVKNLSQSYLKSVIKVDDIPLLLWGMASAIYPSGYDYARPCTTNPGECTHTVTGKLSLPKLFWTDNEALSHWQRKHMSDRSAKWDDAALEKYQNEHIRGGDFTLELHSELSVTLAVPTIQQYETAGFGWVDNIVKLLEGSLGVSLTGRERDEYIIDQGKLTTLRQYAHWVKSFTLGDSIVEDFDTIEGLLDNLSASEEISDKFFNGVGAYIDKSVISVIAIPKYDCPACGTPQEGDVNQEFHPHLLPLDVVRIFFTLLDHRIFKALTARKM